MNFEGALSDIPEADEERRQARINALRQQQFAGMAAMVPDLPGVQKMGMAAYKSATDELEPDSSEFSDMMRMLTFQNTQKNQEASLGLRQTAQAQLNEDRLDRRARTEEDRLYRDLGALDKRIGSETMDLVNQVNQIRTKMSGYEADEEGNIDLPGYGQVESRIPGWFVGEEGREMRSVVQGLENRLLLARSGGAVSDQEGARLQTELMTAKGATTEAELIGALNRFAEGLDASIQRSLGTARDDVRARYIEQSMGGREHVPPVWGALPQTQEAREPTIQLAPRQGR